MCDDKIFVCVSRVGKSGFLVGRVYVCIIMAIYN